MALRRRLLAAVSVAALTGCGAAVLAPRSLVSFGISNDDAIALYTRSAGASGACMTTPVFQCTEPMSGVLDAGSCPNHSSWLATCPPTSLGCCIQRTTATDAAVPPNTPAIAICYYPPNANSAIPQLQALCTTSLNGVWQSPP